MMPDIISMSVFAKLKDGAANCKKKLIRKAKIGGDELDEKLVEVVSEDNWQASTHQLHEIANAAYNYEKWQRINQFIWEKLKKSKSWKKILKTFNLIEFLLKNGPPSIISNFKYDLYHLRTFENYSNYVDGIDKGEPIRERAKTVVSLLGNEEQLEEERLKAKTIREKMSNVIGGYGGSSSSYGGPGYGGSGYDNYGGSKKKGQQAKSYNYGNAVGHYGDYGYSKSTIDKYRDTKNDKPSTGLRSEGQKEEKKPEMQVETKKPFEKAAGKLSKPGEKKTRVGALPATTSTTKPPTSSSGNILDFDIMAGEPAPTTEPQQTQTIQPACQNTPNIFSFDSAPPPSQPPQLIQSNQTSQVPQPPSQIQPNMNQQPNAGQSQPNYGQPNYAQPRPHNPYSKPQTNYNQPQPNFNQPHNSGFNHYGQTQPSYSMPGQYPLPPNNNQYNPQGNQMHAMSLQQPNQGSLNMGITLNAGKKEEEFGNFASSSPGTAENVGWLSNTEKGLIDFSDFGSEIIKEGKGPSKNQPSNNLQIDNWNW